MRILDLEFCVYLWSMSIKWKNGIYRVVDDWLNWEEFFSFLGEFREG